MLEPRAKVDRSENAKNVRSVEATHRFGKLRVAFAFAVTRSGNVYCITLALDAVKGGYNERYFSVCALLMTFSSARQG